MPKARVGIVGAFLAVAGAIAMGQPAHAGGPVRAWGWNNYGQCYVPADLGPCSAFTAGYGHTVALRQDGGVSAWGWGAAGSPPANLGPCTAIAAGDAHTVALRQDGGVRAWGYNGYGQCNVPVDLGACSAIAAGWAHTVAVRRDGEVRAWGWNSSYGQCNVPIDLGACSAVAAGYGHSVALRQDGCVRAWGSNGSGVPADLGACSAVAAGQGHTVALRQDGGVRAWGNNGSGECNVPADLGACSAIAAGYNYTVALRQDGGVRAWGSNGYGQCDIPADLGPCTAVAAGRGHTVVIAIQDCDNNGIPDVNEITGHDCNGDFILDACNARYDVLEDCNGNGLGDSCEKELTVSLDSGHLGPIGFSANQTWTIPAAVRAQSPVTLVIHGHGDFGGLQEYVRVKVGYGFDEHALQNTMDCENGTGTPSTSSFTLAPEQFNSAIGADGALRVVMEPSIAVDAYGCNGGTWIEASLDYIGALPADCNANGLLDSCEIAAGYGPDVNHNGVVDTCESLILPCPTDFNQNGRTDGADLGMLLSAWGASNQPGLDLDHNGRIDGGDLGMMLSGWGPCVQ